MTGPTIVDSDVERLLRGEATDDASLAALAGLLAAFRSIGSKVPDRMPADRIIAEAAAIARAGSPAAAVVPQTRAARKRRSWRLAPSMAALVGVFVVAGMTGVAAAADSAAPGDTLYGIDRALENIGIGQGGVDERLTEAEDLALGGNAQAALAHAGDALAEAGDERSADALLATADRLRAEGSAASQDVRENVADMLEWMATTSDTGRAFGQGVAERARTIGSGKGQGNANQGQGAPSGTDETDENGNGNGPPGGPGNGRGGGPPENTPPGQNRG